LDGRNLCSLLVGRRCLVCCIGILLWRTCVDWGDYSCVSEGMVCEKARRLHDDLVKNYSGRSDDTDVFKLSAYEQTVIGITTPNPFLFQSLS